MENRYPLQGIANELESYGRYGDTELVHLNPIEVAGLASLSPTGQLTINPVTGKKEAFLPLLIPLLASTGGSALAGAAGAGAIGSAIAGGLASGVATGAITGDWERGLASGVMGAGIGGALGAAGEAAGGAGALGAEITDDAAMQAIQQAATENVIAPSALEGMSSEVMQSAVTPEMVIPMGDPSGATASLGVADRAAAGIGTGQSAPMGFGSGFDPSKVSGESFMTALKQPWQAPKGQGFMSEVTKPSSMLPIAVGGNTLAQLEAQDDMKGAAKDQEKEDARQREGAYNRLQEAYRSAQPGIIPGMSSYRGQMSPNIPQPWRPPGYARGGMVGSPRGQQMGGVTADRKQQLQSHGALRSGRYAYGGQVQGMKRGGKLRADDPYGTMGPGTNVGGYNAMGRYGGIDPVTVQRNLRGDHSVAPPEWFRPGFDPEFDYFQNDPENIQAPTPTSRQDWQNMYPPFERMQQPAQPYFKSLIGGPNGLEGQVPPWASTAKGVGMTTTLPTEQSAMAGGGQVGSGEPGSGRNSYGYGYANGGEVPFTTGMGTGQISGGGIASVPNQYTNPQEPVDQISPMPAQQADNPIGLQAQPVAGGQPSDQDIQMLAMAVLGQAGDNADQIIEGFIAQFGTEMFREAREFILKMMAPNAQTEGMIQGQGGGMDDMIPGTIAGQEQVAVSPGEYIVPADVVSGVGDGSSDAGAEELDAMSERVRMARGGSTTQPPPFDARKVMPR